MTGLESAAMKPEPQATVLVVDDDSDIRFIVRMILETRGLNVLEAARGEAALRIAREQSLDLVILDWSMPAMSGIEVAHRLLDPANGQTTPVIMLTGRTTEEDRRRGLTAGVRAYVTKPFSPLELLDAVDAVLLDGGR